MAALTLSIDLGQSAAFTTDPNLTCARNSRLLGPLGLETNPPLHLNSRPTNNAFRVGVQSASGAATSAVLQSYVLTLHFDKIK
jgi:hypothetical protein